MFLRNLNRLNAAEAPDSNNHKARTDIVSLVLGLIGFATSLYALKLHVQLKNSSEALGCDVNDLVSCSKVIGGSYGEFLSIPLGAFGMSYFGLVIALAILPVFAASSVAWIARWRMLTAFAGTIVSVFLAYIAYAKIGAVCIVCSTVHALIIVNFIWTTLQFRKVRQQEQTVIEGGFAKLLAVCLALSVPPLLAGVLLPHVSSLIGASDSSETQTASPTTSETPFPADWLQVSVSNYVGEGEDYRKGNDKANVVVHMFSDLECPHCKVSAEDIEAAQSAVGADQVLFVYRNYPLSNKCNPHIGGEGHPYACDLAMALRCAGSQRRDAFWEYKTWAFSGIEMSAEEKLLNFAPQGLNAHAEKLGLDSSRFSACLNDKVEMGKIQADAEIGKKMGITGTPLIVINGVVYKGERNPQGFARAFRAALSAQ